MQLPISTRTRTTSGRSLLAALLVSASLIGAACSKDSSQVTQAPATTKAPATTTVGSSPPATKRGGSGGSTSTSRKSTTGTSGKDSGGDDESESPSETLDTTEEGGAYCDLMVTTFTAINAATLGAISGGADAEASALAAMKQGYRTLADSAPDAIAADVDKFATKVEGLEKFSDVSSLASADLGTAYTNIDAWTKANCGSDLRKIQNSGMTISGGGTGN